MRKLSMRKIWFVIYMFLAIFEPPILPVSFIYILGIWTVGLLLLKYRTTIPLTIPKRASIIWLLKIYAMSVIYLLVVGGIDVIFIQRSDLFANRIRCINQAFVLSFIEFIAIWYIFLMAEELGYEIKDIFKNMFIAGALQGVCAVIAYMIPTIRSFFIRFGDAALYNNEYFLERRGYGFSMTLIDTFGYGMGLLAGYLLLLKWESHKILRILVLGLMIFATAVNARTGLVIIIMAIVLKILQGENLFKQVVKIIIAMPIAYLGVFKILPSLFQLGTHSKNMTVRWVSVDMQELYMTILYGKSTGTSLSEASFFSNFGNLPTNVFEFIFGSGHSIYDTTKQLGFRTDIGYINLWWEFGLAGLIVLLIVLFIWMSRPLKKIKDVGIKSILILNLVSYFLVSFKAILIGYNPGVFINYLCVFSVYYYILNNNKGGTLDET